MLQNRALCRRKGRQASHKDTRGRTEGLQFAFVSEPANRLPWEPWTTCRIPCGQGCLFGPDVPGNDLAQRSPYDAQNMPEDLVDIARLYKAIPPALRQFAGKLQPAANSDDLDLRKILNGL
jgi:hypothetical protein